jgi:hypothetical protein
MYVSRISSGMQAQTNLTSTLPYACTNMCVRMWLCMYVFIVCVCIYEYKYHARYITGQ